MKLFSRRAAVAAMVCALVATGAAAQTKTLTVELGKLFPYLDAYYRIPAQERSRFTLAYYVTPASAVKVKVGGVDTPLGPDGRVLRLPTAEMLRTKQTAVLQAEQGTKFNISMELEPTLRPSTRMSAAELAAAIDQANRGIKRAAGVIRFAVPKMAGVKFTGAGSGEVLMAGGRRAALPVADGAPRFEPAAWPGAETIVLARTPSRVEIGPAAAKPKRR